MSDKRYQAKEHISIQKFITITSMMLTILLLFQSTQVIREYVNRHGENEFYTNGQEMMTAGDTWSPAPITAADLHDAADLDAVLAAYDDSRTLAVKPEVRCIFYVGQNDREITVIRQWCQLTKRQLITSETWPDVALLSRAEAVLVDGAMVKGDADAGVIAQLTARGVSTVLCTLPDVAVLHESAELGRLFGIKDIREDVQEYKAIWQFDGFLLGGELIYYPDKDAQELPDDFVGPWLSLAAGSRTYMAGMLEESMRGELLPPILWRYHTGDTDNFAVNANFLSDIAGVGILETLMYEKSDYDIYPTINAQMLSIVGFPVFTSENNETMRAMYGRTQNAMQTEVLLPEMVALGERYNFVLTCFAAPQTDYSDDVPADPEVLGFFLRQMRSERAEIGLSSRQVNSTLSLREKWAIDQKFLKDAETTYLFNGMYTQYGELQEAAEITDMHTLVYPLDTGDVIVGFADGDTTVQSSLVDVAEIGYMEVMRLHSIETLLTYSNATIDLTRVMWPEKDTDEWNKFRERITSNISTYWKQYDMLDRVTISRGDLRTRSFLCCEVTSRREGNKVLVWTSHDDSWLILRTHGESVAAMVGGRATKVEDNAYLLHVDGTYAEVELKYSLVYEE